VAFQIEKGLDPGHRSAGDHITNLATSPAEAGREWHGAGTQCLTREEGVAIDLAPEFLVNSTRHIKSRLVCPCRSRGFAGRREEPPGSRKIVPKRPKPNTRVTMGKVMGRYFAV